MQPISIKILGDVDIVCRVTIHLQLEIYSIQRPAGQTQGKARQPGTQCNSQSSSSHKPTFQQSLGSSCMIESLFSAITFLQCIVACSLFCRSLLTGDRPLTRKATKMLRCPPLDPHTFISKANVSKFSGL